MSNFNTQPPQGQPYPSQDGYPPNSGQYLQPHRGATILVLGILGLVTCAILGIIAWVMGNNDLQAMDSGQMDRSGRDMTQAGRVCGMIATILWLASLFIAFIYIIILFTCGSSVLR